jgi:rare lipoprotein A
MEGVASWYGEDFNGRLTASGEVYDMYKLTAAHKTLPLGTTVKVTNLDNGKTVEVKVNDRGPYVRGRIIDLSRTAGRAIDIRGTGTAKVKLEVVRWPK